MSKVLGRIAIAVLAVGASFAILSARTRLPPLGNRSVSAARTDTSETRLGRAIAPFLAQHPGLNGIYPLRDARDAFATRFCLAAAAERTLDVQYYIWRNDRSGTLLFRAVQEAAERGVRVRLLLDDSNNSGLDPMLAALDAHPGIEVRLFNPFVVRKSRLAGYLTDFSRLNRRMHNKSFTADNQATIVGGRNVGDEYFGATDGLLFSDVDVIAIGPVVQETSSQFDRYWASASSYPLDRLVPPANDRQIDDVKLAQSKIVSDRESVAYVNAIRTSPFVRDLIGGKLPCEWAKARLISDDPAKALGRVGREDLLVETLKRVVATATARIELVSPYFVPGPEAMRLFRDWTRRGVRVRVLTNSLEATDVSAVHAGYSKRRPELLEAGVTLYELRRRGVIVPGSSGGPFGSSAASLHAKVFAIDESRIFVGSFNFDPRSRDLNTEMGLVIESPALARRVTEVFDRSIPMNAYEVRQSGGRLFWIHRENGKAQRIDSEPGTTWPRSAWVWLLSRFPIEPLL